MFLNIGLDNLFIVVVCLISLLHPLSCYPKKDLRGERVASTTWMDIKELPRYMSVLENLFLRNRISSEKNWPGFRRLLGPIMKMWKMSGITFTIQYWSEVLRLVICFVDERNRFTSSNSIWVSTHRGKRSLTSFAGLPRCLPIRIKHLCLRVKKGIATGSLPRGDLVLFKLLLTALSFFRATSPKWSEVKKGTITDPFTGKGTTLETKSIVRALKSMGWDGKANSLFYRKPTIFQMSRKAGPNANLAILGIGIDLLGWMRNPKSYIQYCLMCYTRGYWMLLSTFVLCSVLLSPLAGMFTILGHTPWRGRIAVLEEARGKRRLIGITDWWTQVLLKPLHDDIYSFLGRVPQDGTSDQSKPIINMLKALDVKCNVKTGGKRLQSMDLSAATDRLPVQLQAQILSILGFEGTLWQSVLDREWDLQGETVRYAVGQPMGAYSSFACLALTHHVIVRVASIQAGVNPKKLLYAVLGDDGAMAHEKVAKHYRLLFEYLGMKINPIKGFDGTVLEFAKQLWTLNGYNISPLGAKNILLFIRNVEFLPSIIYELVVKRFPIFKLEKKDRRLMKTYGSSPIEVVSSKRLELAQKLGRELPKLSYTNLDGNTFTSYRNWKRSAEGSRALPLLNYTSLESMILKLFFQKRIKKDGVWVTVFRDSSSAIVGEFTKIRIRVLMAIGPRSGLWYLDKSVTSWMFGSFFDGFWRTQWYTAATVWKFYTKPVHTILRWVKKDDEPTISEVVHSARKELGNLVRLLAVFIKLPTTYVPNFKDWEESRFTMKRDDGTSPIVHPLMNLVYFYIAVVVPIIPNLILEVLLTLRRLITRVWLVTRWQTLEKLRVITIRKDSDVHFILLTIPLLLVDNWIQYIYSCLTIITLREVVYSGWFASVIRKSIHSTRGYSYWPPYDPLSGRISTLEKCADKIKLEDSGAYRQVIRMSSGQPFVRTFLLNRTKVMKGKGKVMIRSSSSNKRERVITHLTTVSKKPSRFRNGKIREHNSIKGVSVIKS